MSEEAIKIFYSYSRRDLDMRNTLEDHLSTLRNVGKISTWHDLELEAGTEWEPAILNKLDTADIILLLVSSNFIASKYCYGTELKRAIARHHEGTARVIPVILRSCDWNHSDVPFSKLNVLPTHAKAITSWTDQEEAFTIVARQIRETVDQLRAKKLAERPTTEQEKQRLAQQEANKAAEAERLKQQELERQRQIWLKQEADKKRQQAQAQQPPPDALRGDYAQLEALLKAGKWKEADYGTARQMCQVMGRQTEGWLRVEDIKQFPCADLRAIDQLWVKHSNGKFGFSVQKKIWQQCGSPTAYNEQWKKFGEAVGWRKKGLKEWKRYPELTFDTSAPEGHFPAYSLKIGISREGRVGHELMFVGLFRRDCSGLFFSRAKMCKL